MKTILHFILCTLLPLHVAFGADSPPSVTGRWEAKNPADETNTETLTLRPDGTLKLSKMSGGKPSDAKPTGDWSGKYTLKGDVLELIFAPRDAAHVHAPLKFKWDKESDTLAPLSRINHDGSETEVTAGEKAIRYRRVKESAASPASTDPSVTVHSSTFSRPSTHFSKLT